MPAVGERESAASLDLVSADPPRSDDRNTAAMIEALQAAMSDNVGPLRDAGRLERALQTIAGLSAELGERPAGNAAAFDMRRLEWFDLRNMLLVARTVAEAALARQESRGAHQREDFPDMLPEWRRRRFARRDDPRAAAAS
jgi:succinate dehydrogenase/fumarate reductase flavoprotein subunit